LWSPFRKSAASITATNVGLPEGFAPVVHYDRGVRINTNDCSGARQDNRVRISSANQNHFPQQDRRRSCSAGNVAPRDSLKRLSVKYGCDGLFGSDSHPGQNGPVAIWLLAPTPKSVVKIGVYGD
jgi:hypothetical protein